LSKQFVDAGLDNPNTNGKNYHQHKIPDTVSKPNIALAFSQLKNLGDKITTVNNT